MAILISPPFALRTRLSAQPVLAPPSAAYYPETAAPPPAANPLDQLMAPVALYPDPLISILLPASTFPSDIASAAAYLNGGGDPGRADEQPWDPSVRALAHYPDVVKWMGQNTAWTQATGAAFASQPSEVMGSIQRLRELARAAGTLTNTPQQQVVTNGDYIEIEPAQPNVIYVPRYDPGIVFVDQPYYGYNGPFLFFGPPFPFGPWLTFGCNWRGGGVFLVDWHYWHGNGGWWRPHPVRTRRNRLCRLLWRPSLAIPGRSPVPPCADWMAKPRSDHPPSADRGRSAPSTARRLSAIFTPADREAVTVVGRHPEAFRGRPLNPAIMSRRPATARPRPSNQKPPPRRPPEKPRNCGINA